MQTSYERMSFTAYLVPDKSGRFFFIVVFLPALGFLLLQVLLCLHVWHNSCLNLAVTAPFVKYLQVPACPCCLFLSFADHNLPRSLCSEIALPNQAIHRCTKMRELFFPGLVRCALCRAAVLCAGQWLSSSSSVCWAGRQSLVLPWASPPCNTSPKFPAGIPVGLWNNFLCFGWGDRKGPVPRAAWLRRQQVGLGFHSSMAQDQAIQS